MSAARLGTETRETTGRATYAWTLEQLAALAEFEDDPADVQDLVTLPKGRPGRPSRAMVHADPYDSQRARTPTQRFRRDGCLI